MNKTGQEEAAKAGRRVTYVGLVANLLLSGFKLLCGILAHSQALIADAVHSLSDLVTDVIVLVGVTAGTKAPDERHHFGHRRIETLASGAVSAALAVAGVMIGGEAILAITRKTPSHPGWLALVGAGVSIVVKEALYHYTLRTGRRIKSRAVMANAWHHRSDALSSIAVLIGVGAALVDPRLAMADSVAAIFVALLIIKVAADLFLSTLKELTDTAPESQVLEKIEECVRRVGGVRGMHDLKVRTSADWLQVQVHIVVDGRVTVREGHQVAKEVEECLYRDMDNLLDVMVHVDPDE